MTERNLNEELLNEIKTELPKVEGFEYLSEDPVGNLIFVNDGLDDRNVGEEYRILIGGNPDNYQTLKFQKGNPKTEQNGVTLEALVDIALHRTIQVNDAVPSWCNNIAVDGLTVAANAYSKRAAMRIAAGVEGTDKQLPRQGNDNMHPLVRRTLENQEILNFTSGLFVALSESFDQTYDKDVSSEFLKQTEKGNEQAIALTAEEDEAITRAVAVTQKTLFVLENSFLMQTIFGTMVHSKKLQAQAATTADGSAPSDNPEVTDNSTAEKTSETSSNAST